MIRSHIIWRSKFVLICLSSGPVANTWNESHLETNRVCSLKTMMPTTHHHPLMKLSIKLMRVLIIAHSGPSSSCTIHYTGLSPSRSHRIFQILSQMSFGVTFTLCLSTFCPPSHPLLPKLCMTRFSVCTSWHLNMCNVTDYRAHSLMPSAAVRESAVSISFQERQAEGQRATFIYIPESHWN